MDALPIKPATPHRPPARAPAAAAAAKRPARAASPPATPDDLAALAEQRQFDAIVAAQAEQQREMNALRDLAMQQVKRDDQTMNAWIKLI
ncbi:MAG TPA: hypothetical protein VGX96_08470 [Candidatus Elarobacter sp.]|jgi:hypothetical protein|nr:hypothetical protein [Candidatus Elarobacter sp.]